jgi:hypothetical protein
VQSSTLCAHQILGHTVRTSTPTESPPVGIGFPPTSPAAWLQSNMMRGATRYLNIPATPGRASMMGHTEGYWPGGRPRAASPAPWSPGPTYLNETGAGEEEGNDCAGWSGSDSTELRRRNSGLPKPTLSLKGVSSEGEDSRVWDPGGGTDVVVAAVDRSGARRPVAG